MNLKVHSAKYERKLSAGGTEIQYIKKKCLHKQQQEKEAF